MRQFEIILKPKSRGFHLITEEILSGIRQLDENFKLPEIGMMDIFIKHTSAGLTINENADPTVRNDFESSFNHIVRENEPFYKHVFEGPDDMPAHIKAALIGHSLQIPVIKNRLALGTWQGIYFCEFRNRAGSRNLIASILKS